MHQDVKEQDFDDEQVDQKDLWEVVTNVHFPSDRAELDSIEFFPQQKVREWEGVRKKVYQHFVERFKLVFLDYFGKVIEESSSKSHHDSTWNGKFDIISNSHEICYILVLFLFSNFTLNERPQQIHLKELFPQLFSKLVKLVLLADSAVFLVSFTCHPLTILRENNCEANC